MKIIFAIVREERLAFVQRSLADLGVYGMTVKHVTGRGEQKGLYIQFRGGILAVDLLPKVSLEIVLGDDMEDRVVSAIQEGGRTGKIGDGRIFVLPIEQSARVRTGEVEV